MKRYLLLFFFIFFPLILINSCADLALYSLKQGAFSQQPVKAKSYKEKGVITKEQYDAFIVNWKEEKKAKEKRKRDWEAMSPAQRELILIEREKVNIARREARSRAWQSYQQSEFQRKTLELQRERETNRMMNSYLRNSQPIKVDVNHSGRINHHIYSF